MMDLTTHWSGLAVLFIFAAAYFLVICEEVIQMRKSKPVLVAAGLIWALVAIGYRAAGAPEAAHEAVNQIILEYGELLLFLLVAITYVNTLEERRVFDVLRAKLAQIVPAVTLNALGLDSLLAIELRNRIAHELGPSLPVVTLLSGVTIGKIVATLHATLTELAQQDAGTAIAAVPVEIFSDETQYPLTQNQKAIWFLKQLNPDGFAYNIGGAVEVEAALPDARSVVALATAALAAVTMIPALIAGVPAAVAFLLGASVTTGLTIALTFPFGLLAVERGRVTVPVS